jgi:membrane-associated protease RseP (regulator of RpoE activity)
MRVLTPAICAALLMLGGCAAPMTQRATVSETATKQEADKQLDIAASEIVEDQKRLSRIYWHLATRSAAFCSEHLGPHFGVFVTTQPKGDLGPAFQRLYGVGERYTVLFVQEKGPADLAGLKPRDVILRINGKDASTPERAKEVYESLKPDEKAVVDIERAGSQMTLAVEPMPACRFTATVVPSQDLNAFADGQRILVTRGMMSFARDDLELGLIVAHEMSHNIMKHLDARKQNMAVGLLADLAVLILTRGQTNPNFSQVGAQAYSQDFEAEADYVSLYIMAHAGLPIDNSPVFWRRMAAANPAGIKSRYGASHPSTAHRMVALEQTVNEIKNKIARGDVLSPNMKDGKILAKAPATSKPSAAPVTAVAAKPQTSVIEAAMVAKPTDGALVSNPQSQAEVALPAHTAIDPPKPAPRGQHEISVEKLAASENCAPQKPVTLTASGPGFETYIVSCPSGDVLAVRCELGNCRALK